MQYITEHNRIRLEHEGLTVAEVTFPQTAPGIYTINHTHVADHLRGQGIGSELVRRAVAEIERRGGPATATCSYALLWLARNRGCDMGGAHPACPIG